MRNFFSCCCGVKSLSPSDLSVDVADLDEKKIAKLIHRLPKRFSRSYAESWECGCNALCFDDSQKELILVMQNLLNFMWCSDLKCGERFDQLIRLFLISSQCLSESGKRAAINNFVKAKNYLIASESQPQIKKKQQARLYLFQLRIWNRLYGDHDKSEVGVLVKLIRSMLDISSMNNSVADEEGVGLFVQSAGLNFFRDFIQSLKQSNKTDLKCMFKLCHLMRDPELSLQGVIGKDKYLQDRMLFIVLWSKLFQENISDGEIISKFIDLVCDNNHDGGMALAADVVGSVEGFNKDSFLERFNKDRFLIDSRDLVSRGVSACWCKCQDEYKVYFNSKLPGPMPVTSKAARRSNIAVAISPK